ncbi:unnamed protein product [Allacma fusca]|uniref:Cytochrome P450 n=1 Tax=Allacma fusca TaxID=39272 RepID=A0A8J2J7K3_9HEXA|nr:unnamed protein product [Allacma fusca]
MGTPLIWLCLTLATFAFIRYFFNRSCCKLPGPSFLTVALNFQHLGTVHHPKLLLRWSKKYGDIFQYSVLGNRFVVFNTPETIKSCCSSDDRQNYPHGGAFHVYTHGDYGITGSKYKDWSEQRKLVVRSLRKFGFRGDEKSSQSLGQDVDRIISDLAMACNKPLNLEEWLQLPMMNMVWRMTVSSTLPEDRFPLLLRFQTLFGRSLRSSILLIFGPVFAFLKWELDFVKEYKRSVEGLRDIQKKKIDEHLERHDEGSDPNDFLDEYLTKMKQEGSKGSSFEGATGMKNLLATLMDVNIAGSATAYHTLEYIVLHLLLNQKIQDKVREEVEVAVGKDGKVTLEDTSRLPYTEACIMEMIRDFAAAPIVVKVSDKDSTVEGHFIPAGTYLISNLWGSNHRDDLWEEPFVLKPERFLDETGKHLVNTEKVMSFGAGRRKCLGYPVAKDMLILLISNIVQRFKILPHPEHKIATLETRMSIFQQAPEFTALIIDRFGK